MEVATPPVMLVPKAAPMAMPSRKVCRASPTRIMILRESLRPVHMKIVGDHYCRRLRGRVLDMYKRERE